MTEGEQQGTGGDEPAHFPVRSLFVRERNALMVRADFSPLYVDYYLHLMDQGLQLEPAEDQQVKDLLAGIVLHATTRPWREVHAWTLHFPQLQRSLFATAGSLLEAVTGRVFNEGIRESPENRFYAQVQCPGEETRQSVVPLDKDDVFPAIEGFYLQSEQRPARVFALPEEEVVMISAQPDCDEDWLLNLTAEQVAVIDDTEEVSHLETRRFRFHCGCNLERIFPAVAPLAAQGMDELFQGDEAITIQCPRCAARWRLTREHLEALMAERGG